MSKHLYEECEICRGAGTLDPNRRDLRLELARGQKLDVRDDGTIICPGCGGAKFMRVGLTVGQLEAMRIKADKWDQAERAKARAARGTII